MPTVSDLIRPRPFDAHKGTCGHALLVAGSYGIAGCAVLASRACMRGGAGKLTVLTSSVNIPVLQTAVPEAIVRDHEDDFTRYDAIGIGPGIGTDDNAERLLQRLLQSADKPIVVDADALTIIGRNQQLLSSLPADTILTPHHLELQRIIGVTANPESELATTRCLATKHQLNIVIKGPHSAIVLSDGTVHHNTTGNQGMATAGSGDVLTGLILSLLAQHYPPQDAIRLGVYLHGLAGDIAAKEHSIYGMIASDIAENIGKAYRSTGY